MWLLLGGRGSGKTRAASEHVNEIADEQKGARIALVGRTAADVRDVMVEGESGILECARRSRPDSVPVYEPSKRRLTWPNGSVASTYSADEPDVLRGPQHAFAWGDEIATWPYETMVNLRLGLRLGALPRAVFSTSPKPVRVVRELIRDPACAVTRMSTRDNAANLPAQFLDAVIRRYEGTTIGLQELDAQILDESPGALWQRANIDKARVLVAPDLARIVVAVDPSVTSKSESDECGIVVAGRGLDGDAYVIEDLSRRASPDAWARVAVEAFKRHRADRIIAEVNNGGDLVESVLRTVDASVAYEAVHASRGKVTRAEPIAALYEQGRVHHVGVMPELEDQLCTWVPGEGSPDRLDALVWGVEALSLNGCFVLAMAGDTEGPNFLDRRGQDVFWPGWGDGPRW